MVYTGVQHGLKAWSRCGDMSAQLPEASWCIVLLWWHFVLDSDLQPGSFIRPSNTAAVVAGQGHGVIATPESVGTWEIPKMRNP